MSRLRPTGQMSKSEGIRTRFSRFNGNVIVPWFNSRPARREEEENGRRTSLIAYNSAVQDVISLLCLDSVTETSGRSWKCQIPCVAVNHICMIASPPSRSVTRAPEWSNVHVQAQTSRLQLHTTSSDLFFIGGIF